MLAVYDFLKNNPRIRRLLTILCVLSAVYLVGFARGCSRNKNGQQHAYSVYTHDGGSGVLQRAPAATPIVSRRFRPLRIIGHTINRVIFSNPVSVAAKKAENNVKQEIKAADNQRRPQLGVEFGYPVGAGLDYEIYGFRNLEAHGGVDYFTKARRISPAIGVGYNLQELTKVTHNTYLFVNWCPTGPSGVGTAFAGIRINL